MLLRLISTTVTLVLASYVYRFTKNYIAVQKLSLPVVVCPFTWKNSIWVLIAAKFRLRQLSHLPGLRWLRYSSLSWPLQDTHHSRTCFGPAFIVVSAGKNEVVLNDPKAIGEVLAKHKRWERPRDAYKIFSLLGENVNSVCGEEWPRHRRVSNSGFNEANMHIVWDAAEKQVGQWVKEATMSFHQLTEAMDTISANVLMLVIFGKDYDLHKQGSNDVRGDRKRTFMEAIQTIIPNLLLAWAMEHRQSPAFFRSKKMKELEGSVTNMKAYLKDAIRHPRSELVRAMIETNMNEKESGRGHLSEDELCGNLFILQIAGSDTTSYAISFTMAMLSVNPAIQDWIREEIVPGGYEEAYTKTLRCRAAVMETLRYHTPAPSLPRLSSKPEVLRIAGQDYIIPADTIVSGNIPSIHNDPEIWGDDSRVWKPQRWIEVVDGIETLKDCSEMMAWSTGPRVCPGKKFSLVEAAAVICTILKDYRLEGTANMEEMLLDFEYSLTPKPKRPESASIKFIKIQLQKT